MAIPTVDEIGVSIASALSSSYVYVLAVPTIFYLIGAFSKKIIRGNHSSFFALSDWYLAPDAVLATIGGLIMQSLDLMSKFDPALHSGKARGLWVLTAITVAVYIVVMAFHSHYERPTASKAKQFIWLVIVANFLGFSVMCIATLVFKGVSLSNG